MILNEGLYLHLGGKPHPFLQKMFLVFKSVFYLCLCVCIYKCVLCASARECCPYGGQKGVPDPPGGHVTGVCELPNVGARNQTQVLSESSRKC